MDLEAASSHMQLCTHAVQKHELHANHPVHWEVRFRMALEPHNTIFQLVQQLKVDALSQIRHKILHYRFHVLRILR